jgi:homocysteine S-methyltransferase
MSILLLDGGTGHLLKTTGLRIDGLSYDQQFLAGAIANAEQPDGVERAHALYAAAGADVLTTNSFAAAPRALRLLSNQSGGVRARLWKRLVGEYDEDKRDEASDLRLSAALAAEAARGARRAADNRQPPPRVAASLPPLGECCYARPGADPPPPREEAARHYLALARAMREGGADLLLAETLPTSEEALAALDAAVELGCEVWVSFTVRDEGGDASQPPLLRGGEALEPALRRVLAHPASGAQLTTVLVNCCAPAAASAALPVLKRCCCGPVGLRFGAYANGFRGTTSEWLLREAGDEAGLREATSWAEARHRANGEDFEQEEANKGANHSQATITPEAYARYAAEWRRLGVTVVGGCCGVGPRHVERLAAEFAAAAEKSTGG